MQRVTSAAIAPVAASSLCQNASGGVGIVCKGYVSDPVELAKELDITSLQEVATLDQVLSTGLLDSLLNSFDAEYFQSCLRRLCSIFHGERPHCIIDMCVSLLTVAITACAFC